jgi:hypothetical protein
MARTGAAFSIEEKRNLLNSWKESGLSLPKWWRRNADELDLPHLSTLYAWVKDLGFSTEPGEIEEPEEFPEPPDEAEESLDLNDADEPTETGQSGGEQEPNREGDEEVIVKERITDLEPSTASEPPKDETRTETPKGKGIPKNIFIVIGGALVLGVGGFLIFKKIRRKPKIQEPAMQQQFKGGVPFDGGYTTIDQF